MTVSTDGQICFGIKFEEGTEFPWDGEDYDNDIEAWWVEKVLGFKHSFEVFDSRGEYLPGFSRDDKRISEYFKEKSDFQESNVKLPVELVNYQSAEYPAYILAVPSTCLSASRGYPIRFSNLHIKLDDVDMNELIGFCEEHGIEYEGEPAWYLSSYWG